MESTSGFPEVIHLPKGFSFSAVRAGIKVSGRPDLALATAPSGATAAALFTKNRVIAAPLIVGKASLAKTKGRVSAVIVNAGNANCATGKPGIEACKEVCRETAKELDIKPEEVFPSSTGIIGVVLPQEKIVANLPGLVANSDAGVEGVKQFAGAIMTTDLRPKVASVRVKAGKFEFTLLGIAKGSGMIHPRMATMLVYLFTDLEVGPGDLQRLLKSACDETFNCISVDGDTSTNDTLLLLANRQSGVRLKDPGVARKFADALLTVCRSLALQVVSDGEGVKHVISLHIEQAKTREEAMLIAKTIAHSPLVKTAWAGADPNWGRILAAVGYSGVPIETEKIEIWIARQKVFGQGVVQKFNEMEAHRALSQPSCGVRVKLGRGKNSVLFHTTDLTAEYVHINADYST
jgi:glutamate N-acetyltransferase / amino-acid N-acetyltransferase